MASSAAAAAAADDTTTSAPITTEDAWIILATAISRNPLPAASSSTLPDATPPSFLGSIYPAHGAGLLTARGIPTTFQIPQVQTTAAESALWAYYNQGFQHGLTLPPLTQGPGPGAAPSSRVPKLNEPDNFDGTRSKFTKFTTRLTLVFSSDPTRYSNDAAKIAYAASFLTGNAADWFEPHLNKTTGTIDFASYEAFSTALRNAYDDPDAYATAERKLQNLRQGDRDCSAYHAEFATYAQVLNYDDRTKISAFANSANPALKTALSYQASPPENFNEFVQLCIKLDNRAKILRSQNPRSSASNASSSPAPKPTTPSTAVGTAPGPMDLPNTDRTSRRRGPISEAVRQYRRENNLCSYCGGAGHWREGCPLIARNKKANTSTLAPPPEIPVPVVPAVPLYEVPKN